MGCPCEMPAAEHRFNKRRVEARRRPAQDEEEEKEKAGPFVGAGLPVMPIRDGSECSCDQGMRTTLRTDSKPGHLARTK